MKELKKWKIVRSQLVFDRKWCRVRQDEVKLPNGAIVDDYFVNLRPDVVLVLAITPEEEIVLVRQYRHGVGEILLELPAGTFDPTQENADVAAARELQEETGYISSEWIEIASLYDNPVKDTNVIRIFLAKNAVKRYEQVLDLTEEIEVILLPLAEVMDWIYQGKICVSGTVAAIVLGLNFLANEG